MFIPGIQPDDVQRLATVADHKQVWLQKHLLARLAQAPALASFAALAQASGATTNTAFGRDDSRPAHVGNLFQTMPPAVSFDPLHIMASVALGSAIPAAPAALVTTGSLPSSGNNANSKAATAAGVFIRKQPPIRKPRGVRKSRKSRAKVVDPLEKERLLNEMLDHMI
jgi:hypothetical protein